MDFEFSRTKSKFLTLDTEYIYFSEWQGNEETQDSRRTHAPETL